jgi:hypothetical protein
VANKSSNQRDSDPIELNEIEKAIYKEQKDLQNTLYNYKEKGNIVKIIGKSKVMGEDTYEIEVRYKNNYIANLYISTKSYFLLKIKDKFKEAYFSNFKKINGFYFPFSTQIISSQGELLITTTSIKVNPIINSTFFKDKKN